VDNDNDNDDDNSILIDPCTAALMELAQGVASLAENGPSMDVFIRIVCASNYRAIDPMYHTDKAPLRAYVTLRGVGTDFRSRQCSLLEYYALRVTGQGDHVRRANELEFIVMKGDQYEHDDESPKGSSSSSIPLPAWVTRILKRTKACVHRSPPADTTTGGGRRVIISLDLADGDDDREWYQANAKREWRNGLTQRKSRLVA
jgi:hypothetical protein